MKTKLYKSSLVFVIFLNFLTGVTYSSNINDEILARFLTGVKVSIDSYDECKKLKISTSSTDGNSSSSYDFHYLANLDFALDLVRISKEKETGQEEKNDFISKTCQRDEQLIPHIKAIELYLFEIQFNNNYIHLLETLKIKESIALEAAKFEKEVRETALLDFASMINRGVNLAIVADSLKEKGRIPEARTKLVESVAFQKVGEKSLYQKKRMFVLDCSPYKYLDNEKKYKYIETWKSPPENIKENNTKEENALIAIKVENIPTFNNIVTVLVDKLESNMTKIHKIQSLMPKTRINLILDHLNLLDKTISIIKTVSDKNEQFIQTSVENLRQLKSQLSETLKNNQLCSKLIDDVINKVK
jgi:hypothetical protein